MKKYTAGQLVLFVILGIVILVSLGTITWNGFSDSSLISSSSPITETSSSTTTGG